MSSPAREALREAITRLRAAGVEDAASDARRLMEHAAGIAPGMLSLHFPDRIDDAALGRFAPLVTARARRQPMAQITGKRRFFGREFLVTSDTLDPRPETEHLIEEALSQPFHRVLDLGTGTGCILLTLLSERGDASGVGTDLSAAALAVARENARQLNVSDRAEFVQADWFAGLPDARFDLITSNPPYIAADEMPALAPEVRDHEPRLALTDEGDGLSAYRIIGQGAAVLLAPHGRLLLEIGRDQGDAVGAMLAAQGYSDIILRRDLAGHPRVVAATRR